MLTHDDGAFAPSSARLEGFAFASRKSLSAARCCDIMTARTTRRLFSILAAYNSASSSSVSWIIVPQTSLLGQSSAVSPGWTKA